MNIEAEKLKRLEAIMTGGPKLSEKECEQCLEQLISEGKMERLPGDCFRLTEKGRASVEFLIAQPTDSGMQ